MKTSEDYYYRSYDADERYWRKCQILWEVSLFISRSYENRINKHVVISLNFPRLIASLLSFFADVFFSVRFVVRICVEVAVDRILRISMYLPPPLHSLPLFFFFFF